jgi:hypothetical protein
MDIDAVKMGSNATVTVFEAAVLFVRHEPPVILILHVTISPLERVELLNTFEAPF